LCRPEVGFGLILSPQPARRMIAADSSTWICALVSAAIVSHRERERRRMQAMAKPLAAARGELQELGSYQLERRLGLGRLGEVWQASHRTLARAAAIKLVGADLSRQVAGSPEQLVRSLARFQQEAKLAARLTSARTVQVFDYGRTDDGQIFCVMELLRGLPLRKVVERSGPQPPERVLAWLLDASDSPAEAHSFGLIHGDVRPENLFLTREGLHHKMVRVPDFGLAVVRDSLAQAPAAGRDEFRAAAPEYTAPELGAAGVEADGRADLHSLGGVAWFLLTGRPVFALDSVKALREAHQKADLPLPPAEVGTGLGRLLLRMLAKSPDDRPKSADALRRNCENSPCRRPTARPSPLGRPGSRRISAAVRP
jgi:serine/threonine-protein kinase